MTIKKLTDFELRGKKVLLRVDINSPVSKGKIEDSPRFMEAAKTIKYLANKKARTVIIAHQGRKGDDDFVSLKRHATILSKHSGIKVSYFDGLFENKAYKKIDSLKDGDVILMKNVRSYEDEINLEKKNNKYVDFSKKFDLFVNDAFSVCHRKQGSIILPPRYIESCAGISLLSELEKLEAMRLEKDGTLYFLGGSKIEDYLPLFDNLENKKNKVLASGVLANAFLAARGIDLGYEKKWLDEKGYSKLFPILNKIYEKYSKQIFLPLDFAVKNKGRKELTIDELPTESKLLDVGHETVRAFKREIENSKSIFMKGPLGFSEIEEFSYATVEILSLVSKMTKQKKLFSLLGGGHLSTAAEMYKIPNNFSHISTSGGALIAFISGQKLPGLEALDKI